MNSYIVSIRPKWVEKIASGEKTIEVRKSAPKEVPFKAYIYATKPKKWFSCGAVSTSDELLWLANGKVEMCDGFKFWADSGVYQGLNGRVIGEFICDKVDEYTFSHYEAEYRVTHVEQKAMCLNQPELIRYGKGNTLYGWHIADLKIYDKPKELSEFRKSGFMTEEEWLFNLYPNTHCHYEAWAKKFEITRPPPSINYIEEDLEEVFMTRDVTVYKVDDSKDVIYYSVTANGFNYKVEYKLRRSKFIYWEWRYIRHIEIAINDNERTN